MIDVETYGAAVGAAKRYTDEHSGGSSDAVKYTEQDLTTAQKTQARENIGAAASTDIPTDAVEYTEQTLTDAQKAQARTNIGVVQPNWDQDNSVNPDFIKNKPPIHAVYPGTSGSFTGGTGMYNMNEATKKNSMAYGYGVSAKGDYSVAFGYFVQAMHDYEMAFGKFNQPNADTAFSFGDGTSNSDRHNLMELKTDGTMLLNGKAVKTEGGDDNKLRLGTICAAYVNPAASSNSKAYNIGFGFNGVFGAGSTVTTIDFSVGHCTSETNIYRAFAFGDFIGYKAENTSTTIYVRSTTVSAASDGKIYVVGSCNSMFANCQALTTLDLSLFDTNKVKVMSNMFANCQALTTLDLSSFDMTNVVAYTGMFTNDTALTTLKTPKINPHDDIPLPHTLYSQDGTAYTNLPVTTGTSIELRASWT
jgi:surface protein